MNESRRSLMNYKEVAAYLGYSESYMRRLVMQRKVPFYKIGVSVRFRPEEIDNWLEGKSVNPDDD